jgi:hypothetical protein
VLVRRGHCLYEVAVFANFVKSRPLANLISDKPIVPGRSYDPAATAAAEGGAAGGRLELPIAWDLIARPPSPELLDAAEQANERVLSFLLQGIEMEARPRPLDDAVAEVVAPLRLKLDLIIDMLARLTYRDVELPPRRSIEMMSGRIAWIAPGPPRRGDWVHIRMYFDAVFRDPVELYGKIGDCGSGSGECRIEADLAGISERVGRDLARLAYLANRRQRARHPSATGRRGT